MKLLILGNSMQSIYNFRGDLIKTIVSHGYDVVVSAPELEPDAQMKELGVKYVPLSFRRAGTSVFDGLKQIKRYKKIFGEEKPDKVLCYTIKPNVFAPRAARKVGVAYVFAMITGVGNTFISDGSLKHKIIKQIVKLLYWNSLRYCDKVIFQNPDDRDEFINMGLIHQDKTALVSGSGVNMKRFVKKPLPKEISFLMISRLLKEKGIIEYLEASRIVKQQFPQTKIVLVGPFEAHGISKEALQPYIDDKSITYMGEQDDVRPFIEQASVVVLPSYREGTPRSLLEAMACGRAVITTDVPGCREVVIPDKTGLLINPYDCRNLAEAMMQLLRESHTVEKMADSGYNYCKERYDVAAVNADMLDILGIK